MSISNQSIVAMQSLQKATRIELFNFRTPQTRAFHMAWVAFFVCFFAWFGIAPLMKVVREELGLTPAQIGNTIIASVAITILARMLIGRLCDRFGPRRTYTGLLVLGSLPVMAIGLANSYEVFLLFRLAIGVIGASFVITQYHTTLMFAPTIVGTANATTAGWGNLGGGVTQMVMPLVFAGLVGLGFTEAVSWRLAMLVAGLVCLVTGIAYYFLTQDTPEGNFEELSEHPHLISRGSFRLAARDYRVWVLFMLYAACFGIELTINNVAALYFADYFRLDLKTAGTVAALFGLMNIFARTLGGMVGDLFGRRWGLAGRVRWLFLAILGEGLALILFAQMKLLGLAIATLILFSLFVQMSEGATFAVAPFLNRKALGSVTGIIGAGGNTGAVLAGFLFKGALPWNQALFLLGLIIVGVSFLALTVRFSEEDEQAVQAETARLLAAQPETV